jgi:hypothetical protein
MSSDVGSEGVEVLEAPGVEAPEPPRAPAPAAAPAAPPAAEPKWAGKRHAKPAPPTLRVGDYIAGTATMAAEQLHLDTGLTHGQVPGCPVPRAAV